MQYFTVYPFRVCFLSIVFTIFSAESAIGQTPSIETIAQSQYLTDSEISPNGDYFLARVANDPERVFSVFDWRSGELLPILQLVEDDSTFVEWAQWANEDTLLLRIGRLGGRKATVRVDGKMETYPTEYATSLYVLNVGMGDFRNQKPIWKLSENGQVVSILPNDADHILVQDAGNGRWPNAYRVNIRESKKPVLVQKMVRGVWSWTADRTGAIRIGVGVDNRSDDWVLFAKAYGDDKFHDYSELIEDVDDGFTPLAFAEDINHLYATSNHETDTQALYLFDVSTGKFLRQVYHNPSFDVSGVKVDSTTGKLQSVTFSAEEDETIWFDSKVKSEIDALKDVFPGRSVTLQSFSDNSKFGMVLVSAPNFAGQFHIYDRTSGRLFPLPEQYLNLDSEKLGRQFSFSYTARDGLPIPAYVTLPPGLAQMSDATDLPFIIMPHGGPASRDFSGFDIWAQSYAMLGYGVLQINFRGSTGYGLTFEKAGRQEWGQLMQDDISDGVKWLFTNGHADADRIAIVGASYGGYAALMGGIKTPELFQCAVSFAGVVDLFDLLKNSEKDSYITRLIGNRFKQSDKIRESSPIYRAVDMGVPVLLLHGRLDGVVPFEHSERMERKLKWLKKDVEFVILPRSVHGLNDFNDRLTFYAEQRRYIQKCLGVAN